MSYHILFLAQADRTSQITKHRVEFPASELEKRGHDCTVEIGHRWKLGGRHLLHISPQALLRATLNPSKYDSVVLVNDCGPLARAVQLLFERHSTPVLFDLGDAIHTSKTIGQTSIPHPGFFFADSVMGSAAGISVCSPELVDHVKAYSDNVLYNPSPVNTSVFSSDVEPARSYDQPVIGWMGDGRVHERNLEVLVEPLVELGKEYDFVFRLISALDNDRIRELFEPLEDHVTVDYGYSKMVSMERVVAEMRTFDVAALPLDQSDPFMVGKSPMKVTETLATRTPAVASEFGAYANTITHRETGLLANSSEDWYEHLKMLLEHSKMRTRFAENGFEMVQEEHSVKRYTQRLLGMIESAV